MKKVYLVTVSLRYETGLNYRFILHIFSSKRKAQVYRDFKRLKIERFGASSTFSSLDFTSIVSADVRIEEHFICSLDWSDELNELKEMQCERFDANRIAEEKLNYELTKKYNLLEFV